jgi:hypothetical protein
MGTSLRTEQLRAHSITGRGRRFFLFVKLSVRLWINPSLLGVKVAGALILLARIM